MWPASSRRVPTTDEHGDLRADLRETFARQTSLGRAGIPEEVGKSAVFLASDLASYVTGESLVVDDGFVSTNL